MNWVKVSALAVGCAAGLAMTGAARADVLDDWNNELKATLRTLGGPGGPGALARVCAMVHVAEYDAVNSIKRSHQPIIIMVDAPAGASRNVAAAKAAHDILVNLVPSRRATYDALLNSELATF